MTQCIIIRQAVLSVTLRLVSILEEIGREAVITQMDAITPTGERPHLLGLSRRRLLDPSPGRRGGGGDLHDGRGRLRAVGRGAGLRRDGSGRLPHQPHAALDADVGVALGRHVEDLEAVVVEARELALKGSAPVALPATNLYCGLAVEDCELPPCGKTMLHTYKNVELWTQPLLLSREKNQRQKDRLFAQWLMSPINYGLSRQTPVIYCSYNDGCLGLKKERKST